MAEKVDAQLFVVRFENLKRKWFSGELDPRFDDDGQELPSVLSSEQVVGMFKEMGLEIPVLPDEPPVPRGQRSKHVGIWWKK